MADYQYEYMGLDNQPEFFEQSGVGGMARDDSFTEELQHIQTDITEDGVVYGSPASPVAYGYPGQMNYPPSSWSNMPPLSQPAPQPATFHNSSYTSDHGLYEQPIPPPAGRAPLQPSQTIIPPSLPILHTQAVRARTGLSIASPSQESQNIPPMPAPSVRAPLQTSQTIIPPSPPILRTQAMRTHTNLSIASPSQESQNIPPMPAPSVRAPPKLAPKQPAGRKRGRGANSGTNRRDQGGSDNEVEILSSEAKVKAELKVARGLSDADKLAFIRHITQPDVWKTWRIKKNDIFVHVAQTVLDGRVSTEQVKNYWENGAWAKYKACKQRDKHTGGGDGDNDRYVNSDDETEDGTKKRKRKAKRKASTGDFSDEVLDEFESSKVFELLEEVAWNDETITRDIEYSSGNSCLTEDEDEKKKPPSKKRKMKGKAKSDPDSDDDPTDSIFRDALKSMQTKHAVDLQRFELEEKRYQESRTADREAREAREKLEREKLALEQMKHRTERESLALRMIASGDATSVVYGHEILAELRAHGTHASI